MSSVVSTVDLNLDCPVCFNRFLPPVFQCFNGHLVCETCLPRLRKCPVCQEDLPDGKRIRNLEMEKLIKRMEHPCPFRDQGCQAWVPYETICEHKYDCVFGSFKICSIAGYGDCNTEVACADFRRHLENHTHGKSIMQTTFGQRHYGRLGLALKSTDYYGMLNHEGREVCWIVKCSEVEDQIMWECFILRGRVFASRCSFELAIIDSSNKVRITWRGSCVSLQRTAKELNDRFITPVSLLKGMTDNQDQDFVNFIWQLSLDAD